MLGLTSSPFMVLLFLDLLKSEFGIKDLGDVHYFLGVEIKVTVTGLFLPQKRYAKKILQKSNMLDCKQASIYTSSLKCCSYYIRSISQCHLVLCYCWLTRIPIFHSSKFNICRQLCFSIHAFLYRYPL